MRLNISRLITVAVLAHSFSGTVSADSAKKPLDEQAYMEWMYLQGERISPDGNWVAYEQRNKNEVRRIVIHGNGITDTIAGGQGLMFSRDSKFAFYDIVTKTGGNKTDKTRYVRNLQTRDTVRFSSFAGMSFIKPDRLLVQRKAADTLAARKYATQNILDMVIVHPATMDSVKFSSVVSQRFSDNYDKLLMSRSVNDSTLRFSVYDMNTGEERFITGDADFSFTASDFSKGEKYFALIERRATPADTSETMSVYDWKTLRKTVSVPLGSELLPEGYDSFSSPLYFNHAGDVLYFKLGREYKPAKDSVLNENVSLDIWKWDADFIPANKRSTAEGRPEDIFCMYDIRKKKVVQLSDEDMHLFQYSFGKCEDYTLGFNTKRYDKYSDYEAGPQYDTYIVNLKTGEKRLAVEGAYYTPNISYDKKYISWFEPADSSWYVMSTSTLEKRNITRDVDDVFCNMEMDMPMHTVHSGASIWLDDGHDLMVPSENDVWLFDASGKKAPVCITKGIGKERGIKFKYFKADIGKRYIDRDSLAYFSAFDNKTKRAGYWLFDPADKSFSELLTDDCKFSSLTFSEDKRKCIWRKESFTEFPELYISEKDFSNARKLSVTNPQQKDYLWGTSELVEWESFAKDTLQGILCRPENLDPGKKYPMIVYFYEKKSDELNKYNIPMPIGTVVNWSFCVSNGYIVFIPDIVYRDSEPGQCAYDAVVSGVRAMIDRFDFIDKDRIGLNGHSWGGYQTAYLITRTDIFRAAVSGAPVANMTSAYGGIRWETGKSRMFQYEHTQSRIGGTIWEKPLDYIRNSPVFYAPHVKTPVLLLHNDSDGSVPWEQGIEMFMALRRLGKPAWLLNYKGEGHKIGKWDNRMDYSRRVMSFYDYYLKDKEKPSWM